jgi:outer membrane receptor protein involved in Fe transport
MHFMTRLRQSRAMLLATAAMLAPITAAAAQDVPQTGPEQNGATAPTAAADSPGVDIVVTAQKRSESVQRVPISIQALTPETLEQHKVVAIDDYVKLLPSVSLATLGPGQTNIFFRAISTGNAGATPSAGMYFDETPVQSGGSSLDLHLYDVARVEALSGPQGTLYGASSLSGTVRIISNKPDPGGFAAGYDLQGDKFGKGALGGLGEAYLNLPLNEMMAVRLVGYYQRDGGFIDVVPGSVRYTLGDADPTNDIVKNNASQVKKDANSLDTYGGRIALGIDLDDNWTITPQIMAQRQKSHGSFLWDPKAGDLAVRTYAPTGNDDRWYLASLTVEGKVGNLDLVYSGSYLRRHISNDADYTYYSVAYDAFPGYTSFPLASGGFLDPTQQFHRESHSNRESSEIRLSSPTSDRLHGTIGAFYLRNETNLSDNYYIPGVGKLDPATLSTPPVKGDDIYLIDNRSISKDYAVFGELSFNILDNLTLNGGIRGFKSDQSGVGFFGIYFNALGAGCAVPLTTTCVTSRNRVKASGETHKVNLTWQIDSQRMAYFTYSTGFRVGGANGLPGVGAYKPDTLDNFELGFKTTWLDRKLRVNGAIYREDWKGIQYRLAVPGANGLSAVYNAGDARVYGAELDFQALLGPVTLSGSGSYNDAKLVTDFCSLVSRANPNPAPTCSLAQGNLAAPKGTRLPNQPKFKGSMTARYEFETGRLKDFLSGSINRQGTVRNYLGLAENAALGDSPGFTTFDFSIGSRFSNTSVELFIQNAFDKRGELNRNTFCQILICGPVALRVYSVKPQFYGIKFGQKF